MSIGKGAWATDPRTQGPRKGKGEHYMEKKTMDFTEVKARLMARIDEAIEGATEKRLASLLATKGKVERVTDCNTLTSVYTLCKAFNATSDNEKISLSWRRENQKYATLKTRVRLQEEGYAITYAGIDNGLCLKVRGYSCLICPTKEGNNRVTFMSQNAEDCTKATANLYSVAGTATADYLKALRVESWNLADKVSEYRFRLYKALCKALA